MVERNLFRSTLCCILNNLSDFRWPPKYLRSRERHANRGWKSCVQNPRRRGRQPCILTRLQRIKICQKRTRSISNLISYSTEDFELVIRRGTSRAFKALMEPYPATGNNRACFLCVVADAEDKVELLAREFIDRLLSANQPLTLHHFARAPSVRKTCNPLASIP